MSHRDDVLRQVPGWDVDRIRAAKILVVGAGALGNEVLKNLALLNVGQIVIMDFDRVEASNLSRSVLFRPEDAAEARPKAEVAAERLRELNPEVSVLVLKGDVMTDLGLGFLAGMDVAIGCVDNRLARLYLNRWCFRVGVPWVDGGILNLSGQATAYAYGRACYECGLGQQAWQDIRQRMGCADMARRYATAGEAPTTPVSASLIGAVQVQEAMRLLHGQEEGLVGRMFSYEGRMLHAEVYDLLPPKELCDSHFQMRDVLKMEEGSAEMTLGELIGYLQDELGMNDPVWVPEHPVAVELATLQTGRRIKKVLPQPQLSDRVARALTGGEESVGVPKGKLLSEIRGGSELNSVRLIDLGVPYWHVLTIRDGKRRVFLELIGDEEQMAIGPGSRILQNPWFEFMA